MRPNPPICIVASIVFAMSFGCTREREQERVIAEPPAREQAQQPRDPAQQPPAREQPPQPPGEGQALTREILFATEESKLATYAGRKLSITEPVEVTRVVSDKVFFIRDAGATGTTPREIMVYLEEQRTPGTPMEGRYDVKAGDRLTGIEGELRRVEASELQKWGLDGEQARSASEHTAYVRATALRMTDKPST